MGSGRKGNNMVYAVCVCMLMIFPPLIWDEHTIEQS